MCAKSLQLCPTLCDPVDCRPPGSSVHGILQARILEWVACPPPGDLPDPGIEPSSLVSPALAGGFFTTSAAWEAPHSIYIYMHTWRHKRCGFNPWVGNIPLEEGTATHSRILAWRIPWTEEPGSLRSIGSQNLVRTRA